MATTPREARQQGRRSTGTPAGDDERGGTRERILDVALDLFVDRGYEKTSLREIAEKMGFTKAALYYHFESKADLLRELHLRLHRVTGDSITNLSHTMPNPAEWSRFLDNLIGQLSENGKLMMLHVRDQAALRELHAEGHEEQHAELEEWMRSLVNETSLPLAQRVRMLASLATVFMLPMAFAQAAGRLDTDELGPVLRDIVHDILQID